MPNQSGSASNRRRVTSLWSADPVTRSIDNIGASWHDLRVIARPTFTSGDAATVVRRRAGAVQRLCHPRNTPGRHSPPWEGQPGVLGTTHGDGRRVGGAGE